jgi:putative holliday junction resolvase
MRVLAVDPGAKRIGIAISDPGGVFATPLTVVKHLSRPVDAATIAGIATENTVGLIIVGQSIDDEGHPTLEGRRAARLAAAIRVQTEIPVILWDEDTSTLTARSVAQDLGASLRKQRSHLDELAATIILQSYLDSNPESR